MTETKNASLITPRARLSYPNLFKPKANDEGKLKFGCTLIFDPDVLDSPQYLAMRKAANACAVEYFGADEAKRLHEVGKLRMPFRKAEEKGGEGYEAGKIFMNVSTTQKPQILMPNGVDLCDDESYVYAGMYVRASVGVFGYGKDKAHKGNKGVSFGLRNMQIVGEGPSLSGRSRAQDEFTPIEGAAAGADPFAGEFA